MKSSCEASPARPWKQSPSEATSTSASVAQSSPTSFFLRSEKDMRRTSYHEERSDLAQVTSRHEHAQRTGGVEDSTFGVQSIDDTLEEAFAQQTSVALSGGDDNKRHQTPRASDPHAVDENPILLRKRKAGRPIHPKIAAAAQRIISSDHTSSRASSISSSTSPIRGHFRSISAAASRENLSSSLRLSPKPGSGVSSTPRSASVRSLALSDEDDSVFDDCGSQAIHSCSEDEGQAEEDSLEEQDARDGAESAPSIPQLVMPSLSMPKRRPFTDRGSKMGKLKVLVMGPSGIGKTCLIRSMLQTCEDIVHVDLNSGAHWQSDPSNLHTEDIVESNASTKAYPPWWSHVDEGRGLKRRQSMGGAILNRNLCFIDTPGWDNSGSHEDEHLQVAVDSIIAHIEASLGRNASLSQLGDSELLQCLSDGGGFQVDLILYMFRPTCAQITPAEVSILRHLSSLTNLVPVIGKADTCSEDHMRDARAALRASFDSAGLSAFALHKNAPDVVLGERTSDPFFAVSSAPGDDSDVMDASLLMSPDYSRPLLPSELPQLVQQIFEPENIEWLRHCAVKKFIRWRKEHSGTSIQSQQQRFGAISLRRASLLSESDTSELMHASVASSILSHSGVLVPDSSSGFYRPGMRFYADPSQTSSTDGVARSTGTTSHIHMNIAGWAQDLQRALDAERHCLFRQNGQGQLAVCRTQRNSDHIHVKNEKKQRKRQQPDYTGSSSVRSMMVTDMQDPLGILALGEAFTRQGWFVLRVVGGCGVIATAAVWMVRNWSMITDFVGLRNEMQIPTGYALIGGRDEWKDMFWEGKW